MTSRIKYKTKFNVTIVQMILLISVIQRQKNNWATEQQLINNEQKMKHTDQKKKNQQRLKIKRQKNSENAYHSGGFWQSKVHILFSNMHSTFYLHAMARVVIYLKGI